MRRLIVAALFGIVTTLPLAAATWQQQVDAVIGWKGEDMPDGVHRFTITPEPSISIAGTPTNANLALDGYVAFRQEGGTWLMAAELAALENHVDAVVRAADARGLRVTAIHNHVMHESPRVKYLHFDAVGDAVTLARDFKAAMAQTGWPVRTDDDKKDADDTSTLDVASLESTMRSTATLVDHVVEFTFDHPGSFTLEGKSFPPAMGPQSEVHFQATRGGAAIVAEFAVTAAEATTAVHYLRAHGMNIEFSALHNHWLNESPRLFFVHVWGTGSAASLAHTMRGVLDAIGQ
ncbi:MAG TPA: DUF1259 domain-containing protein [Vicinamibacterales bacterium]|nr:DUF1259 domain-containing protein [Vicinamibacterales bacterium]